MINKQMLKCIKKTKFNLKLGMMIFFETPSMSQKIVIGAVQITDEVVFEGSDCSF